MSGILPLAALLTVAACAHAERDAAETPFSTTDAPAMAESSFDSVTADTLPTQPASAIFGRTYVIDAVNGAQLAAGANTSVVFIEAGRIAGYSGCNQYGGTAQFGEGTLDIGWITRSFEECDDEIMALEAVFLEALPRIAAWRLDATGDLMLFDANGRWLMKGYRFRSGQTPRRAIPDEPG
ncbi:MAG: META domain-containing protein [Xanthomonadales bacterium]|nr:META domain-containing protein [Xanthomonadales bacterium]